MFINKILKYCKQIRENITYKKGEFLIMSTEAVDRRVRRTRKQLRECLVTLLKQKKVQDITVRERRRSGPVSLRIHRRGRN